MGRRRKDLLKEVVSDLAKAIQPFVQGRRRWYLLLFIIALILVFGLGASLVIALSLAGIFSIVVIARANEKWIREEKKSKS